MTNDSKKDDKQWFDLSGNPFSDKAERDDSLSLLTNPFPDKPKFDGSTYDNICANCDKSCVAGACAGQRYNLIYGSISENMFFKHKCGWLSSLRTSALYICDKCKDILDPMGEKIYYGSRATLKIKNKIFYNCEYIDRVNDG
jgi:hypothetical protein